MARGCLILIILITIFVIAPADLPAQCSICTKTAQQLGEKPAKALNTGIMYLAAAPLAIVGIIGYRWYKNSRD